MYHVCNPAQRDDGVAMFTGDTVFVAGLGAFFEGNAQDMVSAMKKLYYINADNEFVDDDKTYIFPGHEYTLNFMKFTQKIVGLHKPTNSEFLNEQVNRYQSLQSQGLPTIPSTLKEEKVQNLFLRVADPKFVKAMHKGNEEELMEFLYNACD
uniref:Hydroxyacylglutathione hydrolase n=1 Tax=Lygus hesperus TaxID=30085 RepID=A0A0A9ZGX0_LYGHE